MNKYYDGTKLLSLKDMNGETPEIYMVTSNRTAGKTTYFGRLLINKFLKGQGKFALIYRNAYELDNVAEKFFKDIGGLFFPDRTMTEKKQNHGAYVELFLNNVSCGYALALNYAQNVKKMSHLFSDVNRMLFDEFQCEFSDYCADEVNKFRSIHTSVARGQGKQVRYVPVYMCANTASLLNPYFTAMGISSRLQTNTKFLKGDGWVLEQAYNDTAKNAQEKSGFNRAFGNDKFAQYNNEGVYLNDNTAFVEKIEGRSNYMMTIKFQNVNFGVREYPEKGIIYVDKHPDMSFPQRLAVTTEDFETNYVMLSYNTTNLVILRQLFEKGRFRFKDLQCKEAVLTMLSY